jgi:RNA polymerase sigma-70 factor (ECF subfamily)
MKMILKDQHQLRKLREGDIGSFEKLFHLHYKGMFGYSLSLVRSVEVAEEVVQDVFYNIWKNRESLRITHSWQSYLYRAVYNNSMMVLRKSRREFRLEDEMVPEMEGSSQDPSQEMQFQEVSDLVSVTLEGLPERTRQIFLLNRQEGLRYKEIAEKLSISVKTVEANMGKALKALKSSLQQYGEV